MTALHQGDILKIENIKHPVLIVSKDFFNTSGEIIGCPIVKKIYTWTFAYLDVYRGNGRIYTV